MKKLDISYFDKRTKSMAPIWGINTAAESELEIQGEILIAVPNQNGGQPDRVLVPQTWLPQNLTKVITRKRLLNCTEFRNAVDRGLISLVTEEDAQRLLRQSGAREEQAKLSERERLIRKAGHARTIADSGTEVARADGVKDDDDRTPRNKTVVLDDDDGSEDAVNAASGVEDVEPGITPAFKMWVDRLKVSKDILAKNEIKSRRKFTPKELGFMSRNLPRTFVKALALVNKAIDKSE